MRESGKAEPFTDAKLALAMHVTPSWISQLKKEWYTTLTAKPGQSNESPSDDDFDRGETDDGGNEDDAESSDDADEDAAPPPPRARRTSAPPKLEPLPGALDFDAAMEEGRDWFAKQNATPEMKRHRVLEALHKNLHNAAACLAALDAGDGGAVLKAWRKRLQAIWEGIRAIAEK